MVSLLTIAYTLPTYIFISICRSVYYYMCSMLRGSGQIFSANASRL